MPVAVSEYKKWSLTYLPKISSKFFPPHFNILYFNVSNQKDWKTFQEPECWKVFPPAVHNSGSRFWTWSFISLLIENSDKTYFCLSALSVIQITTQSICLLCLHTQNTILHKTPREKVFKSVINFSWKKFSKLQNWWDSIKKRQPPSQMFSTVVSHVRHQNNK